VARSHLRARRRDRQRAVEQRNDNHFVRARRVVVGRRGADLSYDARRHDLRVRFSHGALIEWFFHAFILATVASGALPWSVSSSRFSRAAPGWDLRRALTSRCRTGRAKKRRRNFARAATIWISRSLSIKTGPDGSEPLKR